MASSRLPTQVCPTLRHWSPTPAEKSGLSLEELVGPPVQRQVAGWATASSKPAAMATHDQPGMGFEKLRCLTETQATF